MKELEFGILDAHELSENGRTPYGDMIALAIDATRAIQKTTALPDSALRDLIVAYESRRWWVSRLVMKPVYVRLTAAHLLEIREAITDELYRRGVAFHHEGLEYYATASGHNFATRFPRPATA
jgi:hypothetical protein